MKSNMSLLIAFVILVAGCFAMFIKATPRKTAAVQKITVDIGAYPNLVAEQQASLQKLSAEMRLHPKANSVTVTAGKSAWRQGVMGYIRISSPGNSNLFWFDSRFSSPAFGAVSGKIQGISVLHLVDEQPIYDVARQHGSPEDVMLNNHKLRVALGLDPPDAIFFGKKSKNGILTKTQQ